jgi:hypothetical protein
MQLACGECGMSHEDFYRATPRETVAIMQGRRALQEQAMQTSWEQTRWQTWHLLNIQVKRKIQLTDLARFPWESKQRSRPAAQQYTSLKELQQIIN